MEIRQSNGNAFDRRRVMIACNKTLSYIEKKRVLRVEELLAPYMKPYKKWIFFGKTVYPTLEQAKDKVGDFGLGLGFKSWERDVRGILNVAVKLDADSIYLTTEEFNNICDDY